MKRLVFFCIPAVLLFGCRHSPAGGTVVARVGNEVLTMEQAKASVDTTKDLFELHLAKYVTTWVTNELLYQEAQRRGVERTELFQRNLAEAERQLAIQHLLGQELSADTAALTEDAMQTYFRQHSAEFSVREDMIKLNLIAFSTRDYASSFASAISRGATWEETLAEFLGDTTVTSAIVSVASNKYYSQRTLYPPELWKVALMLTADEISFPVKTAAGYFILESLATVQQGKEGQFELVRDEVQERMLIERRRKHYDDLLGNLRKQYSVEVMLPSPLQSDSAQSHE